MSDWLMAVPSLVSAAGNLLGGFQGQEAAGQNYDAQMKNLAWQKEMQRESWERDDTAVQRRAKDMAAAGINPLLAAGSAAGNAPVVHTEAPQLDPQAVRGFGKGISEGANDLINQMVMSKDFAVKDAQIQNIQADTNKKNVEADAVGQLLPGNLKLQEADLTLKGEQARSIAYDVDKLKPAEVAQKTQEIANGIQQIKQSNFYIQNQQVLTALERARDHNQQLLVAQGVSESNAKLAAMAVELQILKTNAEVARRTVGARSAGPYTDLVKNIDVGKFVGLRLGWPELFSKITENLKQ